LTVGIEIARKFLVKCDTWRTPTDIAIGQGYLNRNFKGQATQAIVPTECDMAQLDSLSRRLLYVGLTRARVHLEWVISAETAKMLAT